MAEVLNGASDFVLFPRDQPYLDRFDLRSGSGLPYSCSTAESMYRHRDFSAYATTSDDTYPSVSAYSSSMYLGDPNVPCEAPVEETVRQPTQQNISSGSPSPSVSQIFDHPSTLSSASGASAQSTASSARGSPYSSAVHNIPYQEKWPEPLHGLGIDPEIVNEEAFRNDLFHPRNIDSDIVAGGSKFADYVGEYHDKFSSLCPDSLSTATPLSSFSAFQSFSPTHSSPLLALAPSAGSHDATIDTILEEANNRIQKPTHLASPTSPPSAVPSSKPLPETFQAVSPSDPKLMLKSPATPASGVLPFSSPISSPRRSGESEFWRKTVINSDHPQVQSGLHQSVHQLHPHVYPRSSFPCYGRAHYEKNLDPFFGQSSGRFVAPLESSCWFSSLYHLAFRS